MKRRMDVNLWAKMVTDVGASPSERVQFLLFMRRHLMRPRNEMTYLLRNMWDRREGLVRDGLVLKRR